MRFFEYYKSALRCLGANKLRTVLTTLGIIVGISSVILINTIGSCLGKTINDTIGLMYGDSFVEIRPVLNNLIDAEFEESDLLYEDIYFPNDLVEAYEKRYEGIIKPALDDRSSESISARITSSTFNDADVSIIGADESTLKDSLAVEVQMVNGRFITEDDCDQKRPVIVIDKSLSDLYFGDEDPVGKEIPFSIDDGTAFDTYIVAGVYMFKTEYIDEYDDLENYHCAFAPNSYLESFNGSLRVWEVEKNKLKYNISAVKDEDEFVRDTKEFFDEYLEGTEWTTLVYTGDQISSMVAKIVKIITGIIAGIAAISLFVGGVGVMNVMLVSVTERTMEIGVRKAMGASSRSIRIQFLIESVMIVFTGSAIGILLGFFNAKLIAIAALKITSAKHMPLGISFVFPIKSLIESIVFSFIIGVVFGVYPANKAAGMQVIDALRYE